MSHRWAATLLLALAGTAQADCFLDAARFHRVNPTILLGIAMVESGLRPGASNTNRNGTQDIGMMQINSIHLPTMAQYGVTRSDLYDGCKSVYAGAWLLRKSIDRHGNTWQAVGAYHSETPTLRDRYARKVEKAVRTLIERGNSYHGDSLAKLNPQQNP